MVEAITIDKVYQELKLIEQNMITKEEMKKIMETIDILSNLDTIEQIQQR